VVQARVRVEGDVLDAGGLERLLGAHGPRVARARVGVAVANEQRHVRRLGCERELLSVVVSIIKSECLVAGLGSGSE